MTVYTPLFSYIPYHIPCYILLPYQRGNSEPKTSIGDFQDSKLPKFWKSKRFY
jgi:hypothetical protein